jgi:periodic tryptophan protein 2
MGQERVPTSQEASSSSGREWVAVFGECLRIYSLDDDMIFYPIYLTEAITHVAVETRLAVGDFGIALQMAIHLNEYALVKQGNVGKYSV